MNLLKKNKYSIRKYKVGIFSTLIGTVLLLSNPNGAQALTTDNNVQSDTNQATPVNSQDKDVANNRGLANSAQNTPNQSATTNQALVNHNNGSIVNQATPTSVQSSTPSAQTIIIQMAIQQQLRQCQTLIIMMQCRIIPH